MKKILFIFFCAITFSALSQSGSIVGSAFRSQADSATVQKPTGWGEFYYDKIRGGFRICYGGNCYPWGASIPRYEQIIISGTNTYTGAVWPVPALDKSVTYGVKFTNANTGASTLNLGSGVIALTNSNGDALSANDIKANMDTWVRYDVTANKWKIVGESSVHLNSGNGLTFDTDHYNLGGNLTGHVLFNGVTPNTFDVKFGDANPLRELDINTGNTSSQFVQTVQEEQGFVTQTSDGTNTSSLEVYHATSQLKRSASGVIGKFALLSDGTFITSRITGSDEISISSISNSRLDIKASNGTDTNLLTISEDLLKIELIGETNITFDDKGFSYGSYLGGVNASNPYWLPNKSYVDSVAASSGVSPSRNISTTSPLSGGGDLSADRTFSISQANTSTSGYLSAADWNTFFNKGNGSVTNVSIVTANGISGSVATSTSTPAITLSIGAITPTSVNSVVFSGSSAPTLAVSGTSSISGTNTGDQTNITGNAGTATALQTARTINGVSFDGTANITIPAGSEVDPVVKAINGLVKSNGTTISAATAGTDYTAPATTETFSSNKTWNGVAITPTYGGIGLTSLPSANQLLAVNNAGTAYEGKTLSISTTAVSNDVAWTLTGANSVVLNLPSATGTVRGLLTSGAQTIGGAKTFSTSISINGSTTNSLNLSGTSSQNSLRLSGSNNTNGILIQNTNTTTQGAGISIVQTFTNANTGAYLNDINSYTIFAPSSGSAEFANIGIYGTINATGSYLGGILGLDFRPAIISLNGNRLIASRWVEGDHIIGGMDPESDTRFHISGHGTSSDIALLVTNNTGQHRFAVHDDGAIQLIDKYNNNGVPKSVLTNDAGDVVWGPIVDHGTNTPTSSGSSNVTTYTSHPSHWSRVGDTVTFSGTMEVTNTSAGATLISIDIPVASNFSSNYDAAGVVIGLNGTNALGYVYADATDHLVILFGQSTPGTNNEIRYSGTYKIIP